MAYLRWCLWLLLAVSVLALFAGCSPSQQSAPREAATEDAPVAPAPTASSASPTPSASAPPSETRVQLPDDFPLPIYQGLTVQQARPTQTGGAQGIQAELVGDVPLQAVVEFYENEFTKRKFTVRKLTEPSGAVFLLGQSAGITAGVAASREGNQTRVLLSWSEQQTENPKSRR